MEKLTVEEICEQVDDQIELERREKIRKYIKSKKDLIEAKKRQIQIIIDEIQTKREELDKYIKSKNDHQNVLNKDIEKIDIELEEIKKMASEELLKKIDREIQKPIPIEVKCRCSWLPTTLTT